MSRPCRRGSRPGAHARRAVAAGVAAALLSACSGPPPGVAAQVDGEAITEEEVDDFARVLCALSGDPDASSRAARVQALQLLLDNELAAQIADLDAVEQARVAEAFQQLETSRETVPEELRDTFDEVVEDFTRAQSAVVALGRESLAESGRKAARISDQEASTEGQRLLEEYAARADVEVDPRYGTIADGRLQPGGGSLSVPVSELAVLGSAEQPSPALLEQLPASQKCG